MITERSLRFKLDRDMIGREMRHRSNKQKNFSFILLFGKELFSRQREHVEFFSMLSKYDEVFLTCVIATHREVPHAPHVHCLYKLISLCSLRK